MKRFENKVVVVTGAGTSIGFEIAQQLVNEGAYVVINDLDQIVALSAENSLNQQASGHCKACVGDASSVDFCYTLVDFAVKGFGKIDAIVANAGITLFGNFLDFSEDSFQKVMNLNLQGSFFLTQAFAKQIRRQGTKGNVLLMSSNIGYQAVPNLTAYAMTKAAIKMLARNLVTELSPLGIRINALAPGATLTDRTAQEGKNYAKMWADVIPLGKIALPSDIAKTALFLLSDDANHITGQTLLVDGGWETQSPLPVDA